MSQPINPSHSFCHHCGARYAADVWPRVCLDCNAITYANPLPVAVLLAPVLDEATGCKGLFLIDRELEPQGIALPGGYVEADENWLHGAARELLEETSIEVDPQQVSCLDAISTPSGAMILHFGLLEHHITLQQINQQFHPSDNEVRGWTVAYGLDDPAFKQIIFPLHRQVAERFLRQL